MSKITLVSNGDDWEGLYIDGELFAERHFITARDVADALDVEMERVEVSTNWLGGKVSRLPQQLSKIPKKAIQS